MTSVQIEKLKNLHQIYAPQENTDLFVDLVWTHSDLVRQIALVLMDALGDKGYIVNRNLVEEAALIHDVGMYHCFDEELNPDPSLPPYIMHGFIGEKLLLEEGFDPKLARFCSIHTATGFTKEDIEREKLPVEVNSGGKHGTIFELPTGLILSNTLNLLYSKEFNCFL